VKIREHDSLASTSSGGGREGGSEVCRIIVIGVIRLGITWWGIILRNLELCGLYSEETDWS
jgi:hypothetical protein